VVDGLIDGGGKPNRNDKAVGSSMIEMGALSSLPKVDA
jgi:hypothetical protein